MRIKSFFIVLAFIYIGSTFSQNSTIDLTFTAINNTAYLQLDSIRVINRTEGCDTILFFPDTTLTLEFPVGISQQSKGSKEFRIFQNFPNPVYENTLICFSIPTTDNVRVSVCDILGRQVKLMELYLTKGYHMFNLVPGEETYYLFYATWNGITQSIKISSNTDNSSDRFSLTYAGSSGDIPISKFIPTIIGFNYNWGDLLLVIGYSDTLESGMLDSPITNKTFTFQFATNIPCPETPTVIYEGQVYNTIQIFSQCWLKENLNVGSMIGCYQEQNNNEIIEKYCYGNHPDSCTKYGGLYQWDEMMQYVTQPGVQGICPFNWHLPTDEEWMVLEGAVDSLFGIGDPEWDNIYNHSRGYDAGKRLKATNGWLSNGNGTDLFGFSGLPGGYRNYYDCFIGNGYGGYWWTSTKLSYSSWNRGLYSSIPKIRRDFFSENGFSVRCLRN